MRLKLHSTTLAALLCSAAFGSPALALQTQPESNTAVGPAEIRDFTLPGTPPTPAPEPTPTPAPPPAEAQPEPVTTPDPPAPVTEQPAPPAARPAPTQPVAEPAGERPERPTEQRVAEPAEQETEAAPQTEAPAPTEAPPLATQVVPEPAPSREPAPTPDPPEEEGSSWWLPALVALAALGGGLAFFRSRRRRAEEEEHEVHAGAEPEPEPAPAPLPAPTPALAAAAPQAAAPPPASDVPGIVMRPWLELIFKPARATATDGGASVQYDAVIRNVGNAPARNVRLAARMFNSGQDIQAEVSGFFAMGVDAPDGAPLTILPRTEVALSSVVNMAREDMREIKLQGRSLFIPTVAFNLLYEWGRDKIGQTCSAHVVGREPDPPAEKMAPFRLDLGPRVYRSVGQRPSALARVV